MAGHLFLHLGGTCNLADGKGAVVGLISWGMGAVLLWRRGLGAIPLLNLLGEGGIKQQKVLKLVTIALWCLCWASAEEVESRPTCLSSLAPRAAAQAAGSSPR